MIHRVPRFTALGAFAPSLPFLPLGWHSQRPYRRLEAFSTSSDRCNNEPLKTPSPPQFSPNIEDDLDFDLNSLSNLPHNFGTNQQMQVDDALKERLRSLLWQFRAPIRYAFAYGSGVFSQGKGTSEKPMIDLIFGVTYTQHWHSLNLTQHPDHYSFLGKFGSAAVTYVQDKMGAGVYFNPYVEINGTLVKYGVVNLDTLCRDLSEWDTLYLAGRLQKPVNILRDDPRVRLGNQINLVSAVRVALLLLPEKFSEQRLYNAIAGISYMGDPRMKFAENPHKVQNIVSNQLPNFRRLYSPLIDQLPNVNYVSNKASWNDPASDTLLVQDMDPIRRGNMVRRLPKAFREKLYFQYQKKFQIPRLEFEKMVGKSADEERMLKKDGKDFERRIAGDAVNLRKEVAGVIKNTISWPSSAQSLKGLATAGPIKSWQYLGEKVGKWRAGQKSASPKSDEKTL
ncbi:Mitochondrial translocator assembly and maintenance protein 41 [Rhizina undulata]